MRIRFACFFFALLGILSICSASTAQDMFFQEYLNSFSAPLDNGSGSASLGQRGPTSAEPFCAVRKNPITYFSYISRKELQIPEGVRVMVFSPHPDDESIAASGLIQRVIANNGKVAVVFMTNGDGYVEGLRLKLKRDPTSNSDFIEYGKKRQEEALQAICELGLQSRDAVFLGFPDDGIDDLWGPYWSKARPYTSPYTRIDRPLRKGGPSKWVKYVGVDLKDEIARVLDEFNPDWVVMPDPRDHHPDHATTGVFVLEALCKLNLEGELSFPDTQVFTYLVHYKDYPHAKAWARDVGKTGVAGSESACRILSSTQWLNLPLSPEEVEGKKRALIAHQSQQGMLGGFMKQFTGPCELFGRLDPVQVMVVPQEYAAHFKRPNT